MKTSLVFLGTGPVASASLAFLKEHFTIEAVITKPRAPGHKGSAPVEDFCSEHDLPVHFVTHKRELDEMIANCQFTSTVGVVVDFGIIISQATIDAFPHGIINSHFSLLPQWRGADPISYTVLSGQPKAGVSLMVIDAGLDTGNLITYRTIPVDPKETTGSLTEKLILLSNQLLEEYLPRYLNGEVTPKAQPHPDRATYSHKIMKRDAVIDWREPAETIERKIRAYYPWPKARTTLGTIECIISDADVVKVAPPLPAGTIVVNAHTILVHCGTGALSLVTVQPLGKKEMPVRAFLAGYHSRIV